MNNSNRTVIGTKENIFNKVPNYAKQQNIEIQDLEVISSGQERYVSFESLKGNKPKPASRSPSILFPRVPTPYLANIVKPSTGIILNKTHEKSKSFQVPQYNSRDLQREVDDKGPFRIYGHDEQLFAKSTLRSIKSTKFKKDRTNCNKRKSYKSIKLNDDKFTLFLPTTRPLKLEEMEFSLGYPVGIQLGSFHINSECVPKDFRGKQALECLFVAHGKSCLKHPVKWTVSDLDEILFTGTDVRKNFQTTQNSKSYPLTKCFSFKNHHLKVTLSEPKVTGKIMSFEMRSVNLLQGLTSFFSSYKDGVFQTANLDLYIKKEEVFYIFDPRGRSIDCERDVKNGEACLIVLIELENICHLIMNLSKIDMKSSFKLSTIELSKIVKDSPENPIVIEDQIRTERSCDIEMLGEESAILTGNLSFNSKLFGKSANKQHLTTNIMAIAYSKIDPPNSWSKQELDNILKLGTKFYDDSIGAHNYSLCLQDIPSRFYMDSFEVEIRIVPDLFQGIFQETHLYFDNELCIGLRQVFSNPKVRSILVENEESYFAVWVAKDSEIYYLFDGYEKDDSGNFEPYCGNAHLLIVVGLDTLCKIFIDRLYKLPENKGAKIKIHGLVVLNIRKLSVEELKNKPRIKCRKLDCYKPGHLKKINEPSSIVDCVDLEMTKRDQEFLNEKRPEKPIYKTIADLNSSSQALVQGLVNSITCSPDILEKVDQICPGTSSEIKALINSVRSDIINKIFEEKTKESISEKCNPMEDDQKSLILAEKILIKSDLDHLKIRQQELLKSDSTDDCLKLLQPANEADVTLSKELLIPSEFEKLPDRSQIILGSKNIFDIQDTSQKNLGKVTLLASISATITSTKYSIATWNKDTIDYVLLNTDILKKHIKLRQMELLTSPEIILSKIRMNDQFYQTKLRAIDHGHWEDLQQNLTKNFQLLDRFIVSTFQGCVCVFKRLNFFYMFESLPCNIFGYSSDQGSSCFMRFADVKSLGRRIHKNHEGIGDKEYFVIHRISFDKVNKDLDGKFVDFSENQEKALIKSVKDCKSSKRGERKRRRTELRAIIREEVDRVKDFGREDVRLEESDDVSSLSSVEKSETSFYNYTTINQHFDFDMLPKKSKAVQESDKSTIKGTFGLGKHLEYQPGIVKACHFTSMYAILYSVHHPVHTQNSRSVDVILENGLRIFNSVTSKEVCNRQFKNVVVDDKKYEVVLKEVETTRKRSLKFTLTDYFKNHKYLMLQHSNICFTLVKSNSYHLFDAYSVKDYQNLNQEDLNENIKDSQKDSKISKKEERGGWIRFESIEPTIQYIKTCLVDQKEINNFKIFQLNILREEEIRNKNIHYGYFLFSNTSHATKIEEKDCKDVKQTSHLVSERVDWILNTQKLPWSRTEKLNLKGQPRAMWKEFEIEMDQRLFSLFGSIHPRAKIFGKHAGKQHLGVCIISSLMAKVYPLDDWSTDLLDEIVINGSRFFEESIKDIKGSNYRLKITDFNEIFKINDMEFSIKMHPILFGHLYDHREDQLNLSISLEYFFLVKKFNAGILQVGERFLSFGKSGKAYYIFDCQAYGPPVFANRQGSSYALRCCCLESLLKCIVLTLGVTSHNVFFNVFLTNVQLTSEKHLKMLYEQNVSRREAEKIFYEILNKSLSQKEEHEKDDMTQDTNLSVENASKIGSSRAREQQ